MSGFPGMGFGREFCEAIGLDVKGITSIKLNIPVDDVVTLSIERIVLKEEARGIIKQLEQYELQLKGDIK